MKMISSILLTFLAVHGGVSSAPFVEPKAHPISRYEAGWEKNPFTLKTAPVAIAPVSFAKDLALAGWRQAGDDIIVTLVNTKTREYTRLRNNDPGPDGTKVKTAHLEDRRADTFVELERNNETPATVRFDEGFLRQMGAQSAAPKSNPAATMRGANTTTGQGTVPGFNATTGGAAAPPAGNLAPNISGQTTQTPRPAIVPTVPNPQLPQSVASPANNIPTIQRRRLNTAPQPPIQR